MKIKFEIGECYRNNDKNLLLKVKHRESLSKIGDTLKFEYKTMFLIGWCWWPNHVDLMMVLKKGDTIKFNWVRVE